MISNQILFRIIDEASKLNRKDFENLLVREGIYTLGELDHEKYIKILRKKTLVEKVFSEKDELDVVDMLVKHGILSKNIIEQLKLSGYEMPNLKKQSNSSKTRPMVKPETKKQENSSGKKGYPIFSRPKQTNMLYRYCWGLFSLIGLTVLFYILISLNILNLPILIDLINSSGSGWAAWLLSVIASSALLTLFNLGFKIGAQFGITKIDFSPVSENIGRNLFGLAPLGTFVVFLLASIIFLLDSRNCESPIADVNVKSGGTLTYKYDGRNLTVPPGSKLILEAVPVGNILVLCEWTTVGQAVTNLFPKSSCTTQLVFSEQTPSSGLITLTLSRNFCPAKSTSVIEISVLP